MSKTNRKIQQINKINLKASTNEKCYINDNKDSLLEWLLDRLNFLYLSSSNFAKAKSLMSTYLDTNFKMVNQNGYCSDPTTSDYVTVANELMDIFASESVNGMVSEPFIDDFIGLVTGTLINTPFCVEDMRTAVEQIVAQLSKLSLTFEQENLVINALYLYAGQFIYSDDKGRTCAYNIETSLGATKYAILSNFFKAQIALEQTDSFLGIFYFLMGTDSSTAQYVLKGITDQQSLMKIIDGKFLFLI